MTKRLHGAIWLAMGLGTLACGVGCSETPGNGGAEASVPPGPFPGGAPASSPGIKQIMAKLAKGPGSLTPVLASALKAEQPAWDTIQAQTKEFAKVAADLGRYEPPKGSKESWSKLTAAYAESASELEKAAEAKDKDAALAAHAKLAGSCMACHREHRAGPRMGGPPPDGPGFGPPGPFPGGPPPGAPGFGPPPGGPPGAPGSVPPPGGPPPPPPPAGGPQPD